MKQKKIRVLWYLLNDSVSLPPAGNTMVFVSDIYCGNLLMLLEENLAIGCGVIQLGPPGVLNSQPYFR